MKIIDEATLALLRAPDDCDVCCAFFDRREPHQVSKRSLGGGSRKDARWNCLGICACCHRCIEDSVPLQHGPFKGTCLRDGDQYELICHRDGISVLCDLQSLAWWFSRLDKSASKYRITAALDELDEDQRRLAVATFERVKKWG